MKGVCVRVFNWIRGLTLEITAASSFKSELYPVKPANGFNNLSYKINYSASPININTIYTIIIL